MALQALIFDVDGTLADTERDGHRPAFNLAFAALGLDWNWDVELYGKLLTVTGGKERIRYYVKQYRPEYATRSDFDALVNAVHKAKTHHYTEMLAAGAIPLRTGVKRLLQEARDSGIRLAIATTTTPANVTALLRYSLAEDAERWFDVIAAGDIVPAKKPAPDIYLWALEKLGLAPQQCLAIEDSDNGLRASRGANLTTLITTNDYTANQQFDGAIAVLNHLGEPDVPFTAASGDTAGQRHIDLPLLQRWLAS